jgi:hypothetical protein
MAKQDYYFGTPIVPDELRGLSYKARIERVLHAINALGPPNELEEPNPGDALLLASARAWMLESGAELGPATLLRLLVELEDPCDDIRLLTRSAHEHVARFPDTPKGRWLAELARMLYGPRGPRIVLD